MQRVKSRIQAKQKELEHHGFFSALNEADSIEVVKAFAKDLTFWVLAFQDLLRLNEQRVEDPLLRKIARHHRGEDSGHDRWFLQDLAQLGFPEPVTHQLFGEETAGTRDCAYALMSEIFRAQHDVVRIVFVLTVESVGHVFFENVARVVDRARQSHALKYFSFSHLAAEKQHEIFETEMDTRLSTLQLSPQISEEAYAVVDRTYAAFSSLFDGLLRSLIPMQAVSLQTSADAPRATVGR